MNNLNKYRKICGSEVIEHIYAKAQKFSKKRILFISSTYAGGGVAELLNSLVYLFNILGIHVGWRILHGSEDFFNVTKKFHNALQGEKIHLSNNKKKLYYETNRRFSIYTHIRHDLVVIHDPQPLPLIDFYKKEQPWIFRCHIDLSQPESYIWSYLKGFIRRYDRIIISKEDYLHDINIPATTIHPAIDPLTTKNIPLTDKKIKRYLEKYDIDNAKPSIAQVSRFDKWKDPLGVIKIFDKVRQNINCNLVLLGSFATDDPEGHAIYKMLLKKISQNKHKNDIKIIPYNSDILVNCVQRSARVILQKSLKEGFGLVISEASYKGTPIVASNVGGIPLQLKDGFNGYLLQPDDIQGFANRITSLMQNENLRAELGKNGINYVKNNFLIPRLILDWLNVFEYYLA